MDTTVFARHRHGAVEPRLRRLGHGCRGGWKTTTRSTSTNGPTGAAALARPTCWSPARHLHRHPPGRARVDQSFRDGLYRYPPSGGSPPSRRIAGEHGFFEDVDLGGVDDGTLIWFDPRPRGPTRWAMRARACTATPSGASATPRRHAAHPGGFSGPVRRHVDPRLRPGPGGDQAPDTAARGRLGGSGSGVPRAPPGNLCWVALNSWASQPR
jgi:hypothetical protein